MKTVKWQMNIIESERGWGQRVEDTIYKDTKEEAIAYRDKFNAKNNQTTTPDWYMYCTDPVLVEIEVEEQVKIVNVTVDYVNVPGHQEYLKSMLVDAIIGKGFVTIGQACVMMQQGLAKFTGNQWNEKWEWIREELNKQTVEQLREIYEAKNER